jgi:hypothetical protein
MTSHLWTRLWARELDPEEIPVGAIATFVKAPRRDGEYGFVDALIANLDRCPLTHAGIVAEAGARPTIVHSTLAGLRRDPLARAVPHHRRSPIFLFTHVVASDATTLAAVSQAVERAASADGRRDAYPMGDLLLAAVLLRLRLASRFDEHRHHHLAGLFASIVDPDLSGRMCAAFISEVFAATGAPVAAPQERSALTLGLVHGYPDAAPAPQWAVELVGAGLGDIAEAAAAGAGRAEGLRAETRHEVVGALRQLADDPSTSQELAAWVVSTPAMGEVFPRTIVRLLAALDRPDAVHAGAGHTRFATVSDLMRSPDLVPLGHVIGWADEPVPA